MNHGPAVPTPPLWRRWTFGLWLVGVAVLPCLYFGADPWMGAVAEAMRGSPLASFVAALVGPFGKLGTELVVLALCALLGGVFAGRRRATTWLVVTLLCLLSTGVVVTVLKVSVRRVRPAYETSYAANTTSGAHLSRGSRMSFPSGDAASVFAIAMAALPFIRRGAIPLFLLGALVGAARFYDGMHHFSDVWGSLLVATATSAWVLRRWERWAASRAPAAGVALPPSPSNPRGGPSVT